ncbi:PEP-utilizing enzyme [Panacagrimonas sp.]|uniref:PEP-utilizing enzyme n=1 Tax=Panacagrimonas sp. TaxID=2480088 RepID=UPI003B51DA43
MARLFVDTDKYADDEGPPIVDAFHSAIKDLVRRRLDEAGGNWNEFVFSAAFDTITAADIAEVEKKLLATGYRYTVSATISQTERPEAYKPLSGGDDPAQFSFEHPDAKVAAADAQGRVARGQGDNVVQRASNTIGVARYFRNNEQVMKALTEGVADDTIGIIDDSGGTLTAPILEKFKGVICAGGTVRSHLGILTREYGIPCLMNAKISGIREGDRVEIETSGPARTGEMYQTGEECAVRVWKLS